MQHFSNKCLGSEHVSGTQLALGHDKGQSRHDPGPHGSWGKGLVIVLLPGQSSRVSFFWKAKTQNVRVWSKKGLLITKVPTEKMGDLMVPHIHLVLLTGLRVFERLGEQVGRSAGGASFNGRTLELGHLWFLGVNTGSSWTVNPSLPKGFWCPSSAYFLVLWGGGEAFIPGVAESQCFLLRAWFSCTAYGFGLLSLKSNSIPCKTGSNILSWFCSCIAGKVLWRPGGCAARGLSPGKEGLPRSSTAWGWSLGPEERSVLGRGSSLAHRRKWKMICVSGTGVRAGLNGGGKISQRMKDILGQAEHFGLWSRGWHDKLSFIETELTIFICSGNIKQNQDASNLKRSLLFKHVPQNIYIITNVSSPLDSKLVASLVGLDYLFLGAFELSDSRPVAFPICLWRILYKVFIIKRD